MQFYDIPPSLPSELEQLASLVDGFLTGHVEAAALKPHRVPFGVYEQRQSGRFMVRLRCPGGAVTPAQLARAAELSSTFGSGFLHLTTRQELQIHDVAIERVVPLIRELLVIGLATRGGGGNTVRNIIAPPEAGVDPEELFDVTPYALALTNRFLAEPDSWVLPRKLKIAFSGDARDRARAAFNDIGFVASVRDGVAGFTVYVAGGLGAKPQVGAVLHDFILVEDVYAVARAIKSVFDRFGNRKNRHAARLRFLWNQVGEVEFRARYDREREALRAAGAPPLSLPDVGPWAAPDPAIDVQPAADATELARWRGRFVAPQRQRGLNTVLVPIRLGQLTASAAAVVARLAARLGEDAVRVTQAQNLLLRHVPDGRLTEVHAAVRSATDLASRSRLHGQAVSCTGADTCRLGICLSKNALTAVLRRLDGESLELDRLGDFRLHVSGCPNNCGQHSAADLGFSGKASRREQHLYPAYRVIAGATLGPRPRLGRDLGEVTARALPEVTARILEMYLRQHPTPESFAEFVDARQQELRALIRRLGEAPAFEDDKNPYFDWGSEALFSLAGKGVGECSAGLFDLIELDLDRMRRLKPSLASASDPQAVAELALASARMLLVTRGVEARTDGEVFDAFLHHFVATGLVGEAHRSVVETARRGNVQALAARRAEVLALANAVETLYERMDDSLRFPADPTPAASAAASAGAAAPAQLPEPSAAQLQRDYRGVACPMNFVKVKLDLSRMKRGQRLRVLLDDGPPIQNVPRSVEMEGHRIVGKAAVDGAWELVVEKS